MVADSEPPRSDWHRGRVVPILDAPTLAGRLVRLEPLTEAVVDGLLGAADEDRSSYGYTTVPGDRESLRSTIASLCRAAALGETVPFVQRRALDGQPVGMTRYVSLRWQPNADTPYAVEIGGTWLAASAQRTGINVEAKLLLLTHAFETWRVGRVDLKTDARNERSRQAIVGLGATFEGVLRSWQPSHVVGEEGMLRDTAMFSITAAEWPTIKESLAIRLRR